MKLLKTLSFLVVGLASALSAKTAETTTTTFNHIEPHDLDIFSSKSSLVGGLKKEIDGRFATIGNFDDIKDATKDEHIGSMVVFGVADDNKGTNIIKYLIVECMQKSLTTVNIPSPPKGKLLEEPSDGLNYVHADYVKAAIEGTLQETGLEYKKDYIYLPENIEVKVEETNLESMGKVKTIRFYLAKVDMSELKHLKRQETRNGIEVLLNEWTIASYKCKWMTLREATNICAQNKEGDHSMEYKKALTSVLNKFENIIRASKLYYSKNAIQPFHESSSQYIHPINLMVYKTEVSSQLKKHPKTNWMENCCGKNYEATREEQNTAENKSNLPKGQTRKKALFFHEKTIIDELNKLAADYKKAIDEAPSNGKLKKIKKSGKTFENAQKVLLAHVQKHAEDEEAICQICDDLHDNLINTCIYDERQEREE